MLRKPESFRGRKLQKPVLFVLNPSQNFHEPRRLTVSQRRVRKRTLAHPGEAAQRPGSGWRSLPAQSITSVRNSLGGNS